MTESVLVSVLLFKNSVKELTHFSGIKTGESGPAGYALSTYRKSGDLTGAKVSGVARVIEAIMDTKVKAICGDDVIYAEFESREEKTFKALCDGKRVDFIEGCPERNWEKLIPLFLYETRPEGINKELKSTVSLPFTPETLYRTCDSFYYGCAQRRSVTIASGETSPESIEAAFRSGLLHTKHQLCPIIGRSDDVSSASRVSSSSSSSLDDEFEDIRSGKFAIDYEWKGEQKKRIPSLKILDDFVPTAAFWKGSRKIKFRTNKILERLDMGLTGLEALGKDVVNFFMTGKPGTGKTTIAQALAAAYQLPFYSIPIQKGTEEGTFQGLLKARDGKFEFTSTDFLEAFKNGGIIVLEELNLADPAILSGAIGQAIESPYYVLEDELRPVYRHPLCIIIGTFNVGTAGSKEINPMLSSRFYQTYIVEDPSENEFVERLTKFDCEKSVAKKIYTAYSRILDYLKSPDVSAYEYCKNVTFRGCVGAIQSIQEGSTIKEAIEDTLVGKIAEYDLELARDVLRNVVDSMPD